MSNIIATRLSAIRQLLEVNQIDAFIIPRADEYLGEYVPARNERLHWATGFTGSAGMAIVLKDRAAIFTDGRYTVQVRQQVDGNLFEYLSLYDDPQIDWLIDTLPAGASVGIDSRLHTLAWYQQTKAQFDKADINLVDVDNNPIDISWLDRPAPSASTMTLFSHQGAGRNSVEKRQQIGVLVKKQGADVALIAALDSCCWLLNIRGNDVPRFPVILGCGLLSTNGDMTFFTDLAKVPQNIAAHVGTGVSFKDEAELASVLAQMKGV